MGVQSSLEEVGCLFCQKEPELYVVKEGFRVCVCRGCGVYFVSPRLRKEETRGLYNAEVISPSKYYVRSAESDQVAFERRLAVIERYVAGGRLLDVGCSVGSLLRVAAARGWSCWGLDVNEAVRGECEKVRGVRFVAGDVGSVKLPKGFFDVVVMNDVLEHVHDPVRVMRRVRGWLRSGGVVFVVTPAAGSVPFRVLGRRWLHLKPREHLFYFTRRGLLRLLEGSGFLVERLWLIGRHRRLDIVLEKSSFVLGERLAGLLARLSRALGVGGWVFPLNTWDEFGVVARRG